MKDPIEWIEDGDDDDLFRVFSRVVIVLLGVIAVVVIGSIILVALMQWAPWLGVTALGVGLTVWVLAALRDEL